jgi:hypothetical protein
VDWPFDNPHQWNQKLLFIPRLSKDLISLSLG